MEMIHNILQNINSSKLWFSAAVIFMTILNVSSVEAKSLKNGEIFEFNDGRRYAAIRVVSSNEVELEHKDIGMAGGILLGKYTIDGDRVRIVISGLVTMVQYYKITPEGLVEEKGGKIFYSKARMDADARENGMDENANAVPQSNVNAAAKYANKGNVLEVIDGGLYTYMQVTSDKGPIWIGASKVSVTQGATISYPNGAVMTNFYSKALNRTFDVIIYLDQIEVLK